MSVPIRHILANNRFVGSTSTVSVALSVAVPVAGSVGCPVGCSVSCYVGANLTYF
jgi:hypothetical protein